MTNGLTIRRFGPSSLLVGFAERIGEAAFARSRRLIQALERDPPARMVEFVPAFTTLLCDFDSDSTARLELARRELEALFSRALESAEPLPPSRTLTIPVRYDGADLASVAGRAALGVGEVIERHQAPEYRVHCLGFAPGFPYLGGLDPALHTPRLTTPRTRVPAGSVGIGGEHTGVYTVPTAGGWNLVGTTSRQLFVPGAEGVDGMFLLRAGDCVRFTEEKVPALDPGAASSVNPVAAGRPIGSQSCLRVVHPGIRTTLQDPGRAGWRRFGVPAGGAMDPIAAAQANLLVGNPPEMPVLELCLQGQHFEVLEDGWYSVGGPDTGGSLRSCEAQWLKAGAMLRFPRPFTGTWACLAMEGGFCGPQFLGSSSANPRAGIGLDLKAGDVVHGFRKRTATSWSPVARRSLADLARRDFSHPPTVRVWPGPQWDQFSDAAREAFFSTRWKVSMQSDRAGYRLDGPVMAAPAGSLPSEPVLPGSIQVPANGQPIVTLADGPTIGGYHKLGLVDPDDLPWLVQTLPGHELRFRPMGG